MKYLGLVVLIIVVVCGVVVWLRDIIKEG